MPFGAHETMEAHELLSEKINAIAHFNLYARQARNPQLKEMIQRHRQEAIRSYNELVSYTHDYNAAPRMGMHQPASGVNPGQIQYGLRNPQPMGPETDASFSDQEIACAMLICHKNGAKNAMMGAVECADPHLRRMMLNSAVVCADQAYETFLFMNQQGLYQVPTLNDHTAKTFMHAYQPANQQLNPAQPQANPFGSCSSFGSM
jgi:spore coat protein CotF